MRDTANDISYTTCYTGADQQSVRYRQKAIVYKHHSYIHVILSTLPHITTKGTI